MKFCTHHQLDERHVIKNEKVALDRLMFDRTYFLLVLYDYDIQYFHVFPAPQRITADG